MQDFVRTWALAPFSHQSTTTLTFSHGDDIVYLAQANSSQFMPGGVGLGTYDLNGTIAETSNSGNVVLVADDNAGGSVLRFPFRFLLYEIRLTYFRFPQWGIRMHCETLPNATTYL